MSSYLKRYSVQSKKKKKNLQVFFKDFEIFQFILLWRKILHILESLKKKLGY